MSGSRIGDIKMFAGNFAPVNWAFCQGQLVSIASNNALFAILGTTYGGNGTTNFALPDLRGRVPVGTGTGPGLSNQVLGEISGNENTTLLTTNLPSHTHTNTLSAQSGSGNQAVPTGHYLAASDQRNSQYSTTTNVSMAASNTGATGSSTAFSNMQPSLGLNFIICLTGIFPSRN